MEHKLCGDQYGPIAAIAGVINDSFSHKGWTFRCTKGPMFGAAERDKCFPTTITDKYSSAIDLLPDAFFGHNTLTLMSPHNVFISFNAKDAIAACKISKSSQFSAPIKDFYPSVPKTPASAIWEKKVGDLRGTVPIVSMSADVDWTFASKYWGTIWHKTNPSSGHHKTLNPKPPPISGHERIPSPHSHLSGPAATATGTDSDSSDDNTTNGQKDICALTSSPQDSQVAPKRHSEVGGVGCTPCQYNYQNGDSPICGDETAYTLPVNVLTDTSIPILWFQQVDLFGDDLNDMGMSIADVKLRIMPQFFFLLMRQAIRVDGVMLRQVDTRLFYEFGTEYLIRDFQWKEETIDNLDKRGLCIKSGGENINSDKIGTHLLGDEDVKWRVTTRIGPLQSFD